MKYSVLYDVTIGHEACDLPVETVDEALTLVREVIGDDIEVTHVSVEGCNGVVQYNLTTSLEAVVSADSILEAKEKVLAVIPDADITNSWELQEDQAEALRVLQEQVEFSSEAPPSSDSDILYASGLGNA